jgi:hypothetical protein
MRGPKKKLSSGSQAVRSLIRDAEKCVERCQWDDALAKARTAGHEAEKTGHVKGMLQTGGLLERLGDYNLSARFLAAAGRLKEPSTLPEWDGTPLPGGTLLIVQRIRHIGAPIRLGRFIPLAARRAKRCIVLAEPRLVPLFRRSFPQVEVREDREDDQSAFAEAEVIASYETLWQRLAGDETSLVSQFAPLRADAARVHDFRTKYTNGNPLIGICWSSTNTNKDLPALRDWSEMMRSLNATYVSLQYGDASADVTALRSLSGRDVIYDETVDSLSDIDTFSAQVAAMDAVVTISNTGAHLAGALDVPMVVLLDDKNHLMWPAQGRQTAWYPSARLVRRETRDWAEVFAEARQEVAQRLSGARTTEADATEY